MQKKARQLTDSLQRAYNDVPCYGTIYPLAGYANHGIYAGIRDVNLLISNLWGIGMDVDCSAQTDYTPFSVIVDIASLLRRYLADWLEGKDLPRKAVYGMQEGYTGMVFLSNGFTRAFQTKITENPDVTLRDLFYFVATQTVGSHACMFNQSNYGNVFTERMSEFLVK